MSDVSSAEYTVERDSVGSVSKTEFCGPERKYDMKTEFGDKEEQ